MIHEALLFIRDAIQGGVRFDGAALDVHLGHLHAETAPGPGADAHLWMSLVNVAEEPTLKNVPTYRRRRGAGDAPDSVIAREPPLFLNLHLLFAARGTDYASCLIALGEVMRFFRGNSQLPFDAPDREQPPYAAEHLDRLVFELVPMSFEQLNHLWGVLGGKYYPSAVYRVRLVAIAPPELSDVDVAIRETALVADDRAGDELALALPHAPNP